MEIDIQLLISLGGVVVSIAAVILTNKIQLSNLIEKHKEDVAEDKAQIENLDHDVRQLKESFSAYKTDEAVKMAVLENNQHAFERELAGIKNDIKTIMSNVEEIKDAVLKASYGGRKNDVQL